MDHKHHQQQEPKELSEIEIEFLARSTHRYTHSIMNDEKLTA